jgi:hypothetical protein
MRSGAGWSFGGRRTGRDHAHRSPPGGAGTSRPADRRYRVRDINDPDVDDILDDLAELTLKAGGEVVVVPGERMPTDTGVAAIYRY